MSTYQDRAKQTLLVLIRNIDAPLTENDITGRNKELFDQALSELASIAREEIIGDFQDEEIEEIRKARVKAIKSGQDPAPYDRTILELEHYNWLRAKQRDQLSNRSDNEIS